MYYVIYYICLYLYYILCMYYIIYYIYPSIPQYITYNVILMYIYVYIYIAFSGFRKISYSISIIGRNKLILLMDRTWINGTDCA